ncbi:MAG: LysR family transcriptional regulator [Lachnospiraceae bacterium]|nr:LysR family transcriptional regulator [Lachnospiraceae bacterium]
MNRRQLTYFVTVFDSKSMKDAAQSLMISPQGLSKTIIALENELGRKLFERSNNGMTPTAYGRKFKLHAQKVLRAYEEIEQDMALNNENKEIFNVVSTYDFICLLNIDFIQRFYEQNPGVQLNLVEMTDRPAIEKLARNEVELAILPSPLDTTLFTGEKIFSARHCLIINNSNPLSQKEFIQYSDLTGQPLALKGREYVMYSGNINRFLSQGVNPSVFMETSSDSLIADLAEKNLAIGVSLDYVAEADPRPNTTISLFADETCCRTLYLAQPIHSVLSKTASSFKELIKDYFNELE